MGRSPALRKILHLVVRGGGRDQMAAQEVENEGDNAVL